MPTMELRRRECTYCSGAPADYEIMLEDFVSKTGSNDLGQIFASLDHAAGQGRSHGWHDFFIGLDKVARSGCINVGALKMALENMYNRKTVVNNTTKPDEDLEERIERNFERFL